MIKIRGLILLAVSIMVLLVLLGGISLTEEIREDILKIEEAEAFVRTLSTPEECIKAFVRAYAEQDDYLLAALHVEKGLVFDFDYRRESFYPERLISFNYEPVDDNTCICQTVLEFKGEDGSLMQLLYSFALRREGENSPWLIAARGF